MAQSTSSTVITIADVDRLITNEELPTSWSQNDNPYVILFWEQSFQQRRLVHIKRLFGAHPAVDAQFKERRDKHLQSGTQTTSLVHVRCYEGAFENINRANAGCFGGGRVHRFLDLGCSPGGFSSWLLKANRDAVGLGLTLANGEAKFLMSDEPAAIGGERYLVRNDNIITLAMGAVAKGLNPVVTLDKDLGHGVVFADANDDPYDIVIAGAFPTMEVHVPWWRRVQLVLSQVLVVMSNVAPGGACVVVINTKPYLWIVDLIGMLRASFLSVSACKSGKFHAKRSSCYLVCRGFRATEQDMRDYTSRIRAALEHLDHVAYESRIDGGEVDTQLGVSEVVPQGLRTVVSGHEDLPLLSGQSASSIFEAQSRFVLDLFEPIWETQFYAIRTEFAAILSSQTGGCDILGGLPSPTGDATQAEFALTPPPSPVTGRWRARAASVSGPTSPPGPPEGGYVPHPAFNFRKQAHVQSSPANEADPLTPPASPPVPKWRPQRRTTVSGERTDSDDWRRRSNNGTPATVTEQSAPYQDVGGLQNLFGNRRSSESRGPSTAAAWWRSK